MSPETAKSAIGSSGVANEDDEESLSFYGVIKSYNERRGFGFLACEETARRFGRDVYLSKEEAAALAKEPILGTTFPPASVDESHPVIKEGDFVQFQVQRSSEGYPQAVNARRVRHLRGTVVQPSAHGGTDGTIIIKGDGSSSSSEVSDASLKQLIGKEVRVRQEDCGQLRLAADDEVAFCCRATTDSGPQVLEAQLVELLATSRTGSALLGCFALELPRSETAETSGSTSGAAPSVRLRGHALADRVVLTCLPRDLEAPELMRLFSKLGGSEAVVTHSDGIDGGFASVSFPGGPIDIARFLVRAAHTINEQGATQLARLSVGEEYGGDKSGVPVLPALPMPTLAPVDGSALMVRWSQVSLAAGYYVELRPLVEDGKWSSVDVAAGVLQEQPGGVKLPAGLLGPQCTACRVDSMRPDVLYEARVSYFTTCGWQSQVSANSAPCTINSSTASVSMPAAAAVAPAAASTPSIAVESPVAFAGSILEAQDPGARMPVGAAQMPPSPGWRAPSGNLIPPPAAPELIPFDEVGGGRGILIQWPTIIHATAYTVELYEETTGTLERFHRSVPENLREVLVELRVGNLQPAGSYGACVRCVAPCGCESAPSPWSFAPPTWFPPMGSWSPALPQANGGPIQQQPPPYLQSPSPLLATNPGSTPAAMPPPPPAEPPSVEGAAEDAPAAPTTLVASSSVPVPAPAAAVQASWPAPVPEAEAPAEPSIANSGAEAAALVLD